MTVREMIAAITTEVRDSDLQPARAAELLNKLTALLSSVNTEIRAADLEYANELLRCLNSDEAASRAKIRAETTPEFQRKAEARHMKELCLEMARALKYHIRCAEEEMRLSR